MNTAVAELERDVVSLIREHAADIIAFHVVPNDRGRWSVQAATGDGSQVVMHAGLTPSFAFQMLEECNRCLRAIRIGREYPAPDVEPSEAQKHWEAKLQEVAVQSLQPQVKAAPAAARQVAESTEDLSKRVRWALSLFGKEVTLREISDQRLLPEGCWGLIGAVKLNRPRLVYWRKTGRDESRRKFDSSPVHMTRDGNVTVCGLPIPGREEYTVVINRTLGADFGGHDCGLCQASVRAVTLGMPA